MFTKIPNSNKNRELVVNLQNIVFKVFKYKRENQK